MTKIVFPEGGERHSRALIIDGCTVAVVPSLGGSSYWLAGADVLIADTGDDASNEAVARDALRALANRRVRAS